MIRLSFPLNINLYSPRPIFKAKINEKIITCMLDTGADIPVFCKGMELFKEWAKDMDGVSFFKDSVIGGFGKDTENTVLYNMPVFCLSDNKNFITYQNMKIAVMLKPKIPCDIILSASLFMKMRCIIDCIDKKHTLILESKKKSYGVGFYNSKETIYVFSDEDMM